MKAILNFVVCLLIIASQAAAQTNVEKTFPIKAGQQLTLDLDRAAVMLHTWDKNEVLVKGKVSINKGENDAAFELLANQVGEGLTISDQLKDEERIPKRVTIKSGDKEYTFKANSYDDPEVQKFLETERDYSYMSLGIDVTISLEIFVPKSTHTTVTAKHGNVEVVGFDAPLNVTSKFGIIDATIVTQATGELTARARFGEILTNLNLKFDEGAFPDRGKRDSWTEISAKPGKGPAYRFEARFGNVYLRKP